MGTYKDLNDYEILYLVEDNVDEAADILFEKYKPIVLKLASYYQISGSKLGIEMDDLIQEGYMGLYFALKNFSNNRSTIFYTYATLTIRSRMLNCLKTASTQKNYLLNSSVSLMSTLGHEENTSLLDVVEDSNATRPDSFYDLHQFECEIRKFLLNLPKQQAEVFELKLGGFSNQDIAMLLELNTKRISNILFVVREKLRTYLLKY